MKIVPGILAEFPRRMSPFAERWEHVSGEGLFQPGFPDMNWKPRMKDFSNASFSPDLIRTMEEALEAAVATLPHPVSSKRVQNIAESILRSANQGERDPRKLQAMALLEMQLRTDVD